MPSEVTPTFTAPKGIEEKFDAGVSSVQTSCRYSTALICAGRTRTGVFWLWCEVSRGLTASKLLMKMVPGWPSASPDCGGR